MLHRLTETDRRLALDERRFVQGGINLDEVEVSLEEGGAFSECDTVLLTMERCGMAPVPVRLDTMRVAVPASLMDVPGTLRFSLTGYVGDEVRATTERMRADKCGRVVPSGIIGGGPAPRDVAPDLWKQLMDEVDAATAGAEETLERAEGAAKMAEGAASAAAAASSSAAGSESKASTAAQSADDSAAAAADSAKSADDSATEAGNAKTAAEDAKAAAEKAETDAESSKTAAEGSATSAATSAQQASESAEQAAASAQTASEKAASVLDHYIESATATTLDPGSESTATVADKVLRLGIPRGDPGDVSAVTVAEGSDLSVSTDEGTVTIDDSALRERIAELENQAANVVTGTSTDLVAHGDDAYAQKPIETRIKGKTWVNRWPVISGTSNGITVSTDETGLITISGTSTGRVGLTNRVYSVAANKSVTVKLSSSISGVSINVQSYANGEFIANIANVGSNHGNRTEATGVISSNATHLVCEIAISANTTVNASFRVMLVDGTEAPDCFTPPASITSVQPGNLVTAGKNLLSSSTFAGESTVQGVINFSLPAGTYTLSCYNAEDWWTDNSDRSTWYIHDANGNLVTKVNMGSPSVGSRSSATFTLPRSGDFTLYTYKIGITEMATDIQLELGSTATTYEPPTVTTTPLPEVELRSLPNGTCDELVIKADGSCVVERNVTEYEVQGTETIIAGEHSNGQKYAVVKNIASSSSSSSSMLSDHYSCGAYGITDMYAYVPNQKDLVINDSRFTDVVTAKSILASEKPKFVFEVTRTEEPQSPVTLPVLPAPTFNQYHDADVPSDTSTEYARDINIVLSNLEAVWTALLGGE